MGILMRILMGILMGILTGILTGIYKIRIKIWEYSWGCPSMGIPQARWLVYSVDKMPSKTHG